MDGLEHCVKRALDGDRAAFGQLVSHYRGMVFGLCYSMTGNAADAEDLSHDTFVEAYLKLRQLRQPERFEAWLKTLALNLCRMWHRKRRTAKLLPQEPAQIAEGFIPPNIELSSLAPAHRQVLVLFYWGGLSCKEIAQLLGKPSGTVLSRLHRARQTLKGTLLDPTTNPEFPMPPNADFGREVDAEIRLLLDGATANTQLEKLSSLLEHTPDHFAKLLRKTADEAVEERLVALLQRLGKPLFEILLGCAFSSEAPLRHAAHRLLLRWVTSPQRHPPFQVFVFAELLLDFPAKEKDKAALLAELANACRNVHTFPLLANLTLCFAPSTVPILLQHYWRLPTEKVLYGVPHFGPHKILQRTGVHFFQVLLPALNSTEPARQLLGLNGLETLARGRLRQGSTANQDRIIRFTPAFVPLADKQLASTMLAEAITLTLPLLHHNDKAVSNKAIRVLGLLGAPNCRTALEQCLSSAQPSTRLAAVQALAAGGFVQSIPVLADFAKAENWQERKAAAEALGRLKGKDALPALLRLLQDDETKVRLAAVLALGEFDDQQAQQTLQLLTKNKDKKLARAAANGLYGGQKTQRPQSAPTQKRLQRLRGDSQPQTDISTLEVIRALPTAGPYEELALTELIARHCTDYATTRRLLVEPNEGPALMGRQKGTYTLSATGIAVWRVENFIKKNYLRGL